MDEAYYKRWWPVLYQIARSEFQLTSDEADDIADDVLLSTLLRADKIENTHAWLTAALRAACRRHAQPVQG
ncbi:MAG TPA: hypothetical protein VF618_26170 [Thermoanaerobaculia bacterium]